MPKREVISARTLNTFGRRVEQLLNARDPAFDRKVFDWDAFTDRVLAGFQVDEPSRRKLRADLAKNSAMIAVFNQTIGGDWHAHFLRTLRRDGHDWILLRLTRDALFGYQEILVEKHGDELRACDGFLHLQGQSMSDMIRHLSLPDLVEMDSRLKGKLQPAESLYLAHLDEIKKLQQLVMENQQAEALAVYESLPASVQKVPNIRIMRLDISADAAEYAKRLDALRGQLPPASISMLALHGFVMARNFQGAMHAIDQIQEAVGGDPYLDYQRALVREAAGQTQEAKKLLRRAIEAEKEMAAPYWELVAISLAEHDFAATARLLDETAAAFGLEFNDLTQLPPYAEFVQSQEYQDWLARRDSREGQADATRPGDEAGSDADVSAALWTIPVVMVSYLPVRDGLIDIKVTGDWGESLEETRTKIQQVERETLQALAQGSRFRAYKNPAARPSLEYRVAGEFEFLEPLPTRDPKGDQAPMTDYRAIMKRIDARHLVEDRGVKEVWIFAYHGGKVGLWESNMAGPYGDISNSDRDPADLPIFSHTYTVYHYNYQRSSHEAVENHTHQIEALLNHVDGRDSARPDEWPDLMFWGKFVGSDVSHKIVTDPAHCGWTHYPPNAEHDYDWANERTVRSDIEDWKPDGSGEVHEINCKLWQCNDLDWKIFWMQSLPGRENGLVYEDRPLENWWIFVADWDFAMKEKLELVESAGR